MATMNQTTPDELDDILAESRHEWVEDTGDAMVTCAVHPSLGRVICHNSAIGCSYYVVT